MTATVDFNLPESVKVTGDEIRMIVAAHLFDIGELSSGQAAKLAGITKREFIESVGRYGVSIFQYSAEELEDDLKRQRDELSIEDRVAIVEELAGIAAVAGNEPPTDREWREARTDYLIEKYR